MIFFSLSLLKKLYSWDMIQIVMYIIITIKRNRNKQILMTTYSFIIFFRFSYYLILCCDRRKSTSIFRMFWFCYKYCLGNYRLSVFIYLWVKPEYISCTRCFVSTQPYLCYRLSDRHEIWI